MKFNMQAEQKRKRISSRNKKKTLLSPQHILFNIESSTKTFQGKMLENQHPCIDISWAGLQDFSQLMKT